MHLSPNDNNNYRHITLDNGLRALLIQDTSAQKAAAALAVNVGHFDDPKEREGLAHYVEHMLFLGTEKYPKAGGFQKFISQHGGHNNAWTGTEHTCFFFDITPRLMEEALNRFSRFFIDPLFNPEALDKERQAVDSEYRLKLNDEMRRLYQVYKEVINPLHPFAKFSVGSLETLDDKEGSTIRDEIVQFYKQQYSSDLMTLAILAPQELDTTESWIREKFSLIKNRALSGKVVQEDLLREQDKGIFVKVKPVRESRKLIIAFHFPSMSTHYSTKPLSYFAHLLGYEGEGSLMLYLKQKQWITLLTAGSGVSGSNFREFTINLNLTEQGLKHSDDIVEAVFAFIALIKKEGIAQWRFKEKQAVLESAFRYQEKSRPLDTVSRLAMNLQHYPQQDTIYGDYKMSDYDEALLKALVNSLTPQNSRITLIADGDDFQHEAKWYFTPYSVHKITPQQITMWQTPQQNQALTLPPSNPFICYNADPQELESHLTKPCLIEDKPGFRLWHLQETEFRVPKGHIFLAIDSPHTVSTPRNIVKMRLCVEMFLDLLAKWTYPAEIAGIGYNVYPHQGGVSLSFSGFSRKQPELLKIILDQFRNRDFNADRFRSIKKQLLRSWHNAKQDRPVSQLFNTMTGILQPNNPPYSTMIEALETIEVDELPQFVEALLAELHIEMFVYGDWKKTQALEIADIAKQTLRIRHQQYEESLRPLVKLGENSGTFQREVSCHQNDSAIVVYYQSQQKKPKDIALYTLANHLMSAAFFNEIRTRQQMGYMVGTGNMPLNRYPGLILYIQSPKYAPKTLLSAIDNFLNDFYMVLLELNEYQWHSSKRGLWDQIAAPDTNLRSRAQRLWVAISNKDYDFNHKEQVLEELKLLSRADMMRFVVNVLKPRTATRLIMHSKGNQHQQTDSLHFGSEIESIEVFQEERRSI